MEVKFSDGESIIADEQHEWLTIDRRARKSAGRRTGGPNLRNTDQCKPRNNPSVVTTKEISATVYDGREVNHAIGVARPLVLPQAELPIPPYTFGAWLGDGTSTTAAITSADQEVIEAIRNEGIGVKKLVGKADNAASPFAIFTPGVRSVRDPVNGRMVSDSRNLLVKLRNLGVLGNKHIPMIFKRSSVAQRSDLLAGLMDTDGYAAANGICEFTTTSARLADDFYELCVSLGIKATSSEGVATLYGRIIGPKYRICFTSYSPVFRIARKLNRQRPKGSQGERQLRRYIVAVNPVPSVPVKCIQVDSPSHLYLAGRGMVPTHNSVVGSADLIGRSKPGRLYMIGSPTYRMLADSTLRGFKDECKKSGMSLKINKSEMTGMLGNGAEVLFRSADDPEKFRGPNLSGLWLDEASLMHHDAYLIAIACLRQGGETGWCTATFTPKGMAHWTYDVFGSDKPGTAVFHAATKENIFNPADFEAEMRSQYTHEFADQELGGEFLLMAGTLFNPSAWPTYFDLGDAYKYGSRLFYAKDVPIVITVDAASTNKEESDYTAFVVSGLTDQGEVLILEVVNQRWPLKRVVPELAKLCQRWKPQAVGIEADNFQQSLVDECRFFTDIPAVKPLHTKGRNKRTRATAAVIKSETNKIWLPASEQPWLKGFKKQLSSFTGLDKREQDDMVDALAYVTEMTREFGMDEVDDLMGVFGRRSGM